MVNLKIAAFATATLAVCEITSVKAQVVDRPIVSGRQAVVTSDEPLASMAGMRMLQQGGNAFDAAVATAVAVGVLDPRMGSIGGNGFATVYVAKSREVRALNFYGSAPEHATARAYQGKDYSHGALSVPVPSSLKGFETLHQAYGRLPWSKVLGSQCLLRCVHQSFIHSSKSKYTQRMPMKCQ